MHRPILKSHVKGHLRILDGKTVWIPDYENNRVAIGRPATLHERTAFGKHKDGSTYLRATDKEDANEIRRAAARLKIPFATRNAKANHHGMVASFEHFHTTTPEHALLIQQELTKIQDEPEAIQAGLFDEPVAPAPLAEVTPAALPSVGTVTEPSPQAAPAKAEKKVTYKEAIRINLEAMGTAESEWRAVPIKGMADTTDDKGQARKMPEFDFPQGFAPAPTMYEGECCGLCGTGIKNVYWLQHDDKKWTLPVGSECVTHFEGGKSGEDLAAEAKQAMNLAAFTQAKYAREKVYSAFYYRAGKDGELSGYPSERLRHRQMAIGQAHQWKNPEAHKLFTALHKITHDSAGKPTKEVPATMTRWVGKNGDTAAELIRRAEALVGTPANAGGNREPPEGPGSVLGEAPETGPHGPIFRQFHHDDQGAITHLTSLGTGEAIGALFHSEVGDIDLVWGQEGTAGKNYEDGAGLAKITKKHPEMLANLQAILGALPVKSKSANRVVLESTDHRAIVRLSFDSEQKTWLLTALELKNVEAGGDTRTGSVALEEGNRPPTSFQSSIGPESRQSKSSPQEGDIDENGLVFRDSRWHREEESNPSIISNSSPEAPAVPRIAHTFTNEDDGMESHVVERPDGRWAVALKDVDSGEFSPSVTIFPTEEQAVARAEEVLGPKAQAPVVPTKLQSVLDRMEASGGIAKFREGILQGFQSRKSDHKARAVGVIKELAASAGVEPEVLLEAMGIKQTERTRSSPKPKVTLPPAPEGSTFDSDDPNSPNYRFRDTGHIGGSRKEAAATRIREMSRTGQQVQSNDVNWELLEQNPREAVELITKSNCFGDTNWEALKESGMEPGTGFLLQKVYASVPSAPEDNPGARKAFVAGMATLRERLESRFTPDELRTALAEISTEARGTMLNLEQQAEWTVLDSARKAINGPWHERRLRTDALYEEWNQRKTDRYRAEGKANKFKKNVPPEIQEEIAAAKAAEQAADEVWQAALERDLWVPSDPLNKFSNKHPLEIARDKASKAVWDFERKCQAENVNQPMAKMWGTFGKQFEEIASFRNDTFRNHFATVKAGKVKDWSWQEKATAPRGITKQAQRFQLLVADTHDRIGGRPLIASSTATLKQTFGLRDVDCGNYVLRDPVSAKFHVEQCSGAMADLADVLGLPDDQLSMNGRLAIGFGARGMGSKTGLAHYDSMHRVINITKEEGAGHLAHEWFHALDNLMVGAVKGQEGAAREFGTWNNLQGTPEGDAFRNLVKAMQDGPHRETSTILWNEHHEKRAGYIKERRTKYGSNIGTYLNKQDGIIANATSAQEAHDGLDAFFKSYAQSRREYADLRKKSKGAITKEQNEILQAKSDYIKIAMAYHATPDAGKREATVQIGQPSSRFYLDAQELDAFEERGPLDMYWSTPHEMAARAFAGYMEDELTRQGRKSDYLTCKTNNIYYNHRPYADGEERERIGHAMRDLFNVLKQTRAIEKALGHWHGHEFTTRTGKIGWQKDYQRETLPVHGTSVGKGPGGGASRPVYQQPHDHPKTIPQMQSEVAAFVAAVQSGTPTKSKIPFNLINSNKSNELATVLGRPIQSGSPEFILQSNVVHSTNRHPNLTPADWGRLPLVANNYHGAFLLKVRGGDTGPRVLFVMFDGSTAYVYIAELAEGPTHGGPRFNVTTFFKDTPNAVLAHLKQNATDQKSVARCTELTQAASGGISQTSRSSGP